MPSWSSGVEVLRFIQSFRSPVLDYIFAGFTFLGVEAFYLLVIPVLYWCVNKRYTYRLSLVFISSVFLNNYLKEYFHTPRPSPSQVRVWLKETAGGYSFPSGHAQGTATFWGYLAIKVRRTWFTILAAFIVAMVMLSRLYLGVHWPIDVLGGLAIGVAFLLVSYWVVEWWDEQLVSMTWPLAALAAAALPSLLLFLSQSRDSISLAGLLAGLGAGYILEGEFVHFRENTDFIRNVLKVIIGLAGMYAARAGLKAILPDTSVFVWLRYVLVGMWGSLFAPWLYTLIWPEMVGHRFR